MSSSSSPSNAIFNLFDNDAEDSKMVTCKICNTMIKNEDESTGSLWHHLKDFHETTYSELRSNIKRKFEHLENISKKIRKDSDLQRSDLSSSYTSIQFDSSMDKSNSSVSFKKIKIESSLDKSDLGSNSKPLNFDLKKSDLSSSSEEEEDTKESLAKILTRNNDRSQSTKQITSYR
jgi:hypothetical protein